MNPSAKNRRRQRLNRNHSYNVLETRRLLAGDVTIVEGGGVLTILGDALANEIEVTQNQSGQIVITGVDTTVNGGAAVTSSGQHDHVTFVMAGGNDRVVINNVNINKQLTFHGQAGADRLTLSNVDMRYLHVQGNDGNDTFEIDASVRKSAYFFLGDGNDTLAISNLRSGRNLKVFGGNGNDTFVSSTATVNRKFEINLENGNDRVLLTGRTSAGRKALINTGLGNDFVSIRPQQSNGNQSFIGNRSISFELGAGNDSAEVAGPVSAKGSFRINGGDGTDSLSQNGVGTLTGFEQTATDSNARVDAIFVDLDALDIDSSVFSGIPNVVDPVIEVNVNTVDSTLQVTGGDDPVSIDSTLTVTGTESAVISQATIGIDNFQSGEDILSFAGNGLEANFDDSTGVLTLTGDDTLANYQAALRQVQFQNTSLTPNTSAREIQIALTVGDQTFTGNRALQINEPAPVGDLTITPTSDTSTGESVPHIVDNGIVIDVPGSTTLNGLVVRITDGLDTVNDQLEVVINNDSNIRQSYNSATGELTLEGTAPVSEYQTALQSLGYNNQDGTLPINRTIQYEIVSGLRNATANVTIELTAPAT